MRKYIPCKCLIVSVSTTWLSLCGRAQAQDLNDIASWASSTIENTEKLLPTSPVWAGAAKIGGKISLGGSVYSSYQEQYEGKKRSEIISGLMASVAVDLKAGEAIARVAKPFCRVKGTIGTASCIAAVGLAAGTVWGASSGAKSGAQTLARSFTPDAPQTEGGKGNPEGAAAPPLTSELGNRVGWKLVSTSSGEGLAQEPECKTKPTKAIDIASADAANSSSEGGMGWGPSKVYGLQGDDSSAEFYTVSKSSDIYSDQATTIIHYRYIIENGILVEINEINFQQSGRVENFAEQSVYEPCQIQ